MTDPTHQGKTDPEIQRMLETLLRSRGSRDLSDEPLIGKYIEGLIRDPHDALAAEILSKMPENDQKLLFDDLRRRLDLDRDDE